MVFVCADRDVFMYSRL